MTPSNNVQRIVVYIDYLWSHVYLLMRGLFIEKAALYATVGRPKLPP